MEQGYYCRPLTEYPAEIEIHLRPSNYNSIIAGNNALGLTTTTTTTTIVKKGGSSDISSGSSSTSSVVEIQAEVHSNPTETRAMFVKSMLATDYRPHAVCTVQTFRNAHTGK